MLVRERVLTLGNKAWSSGSCETLSNEGSVFTQSHCSMPQLCLWLKCQAKDHHQWSVLTSSGQYIHWAPILHQFSYQSYCFSGGTIGKNLPANAGNIRDMSSIPGGEDPLEEGMATHSSILAWRISWTQEPRRLWSILSQRIGHD